MCPCGGFELGDGLVINDGKLDLAPGAGGGLPTLIVNISKDDSDNFVADKTYQEIVDAYVNGIQVVAVYGPATLYLSYCPAEISTFEEVPHLSFFTTFAGSANIIIIAVLQMNNKGNISLIEKSIT